MDGLRALGPDFDPEIVAGIDARLARLRGDEAATILLAVESGSRAWGFPSPDSDYDCRFLYARRRNDYLSLFPPRDVIEIAPDATYDINGWDLTKALRLLLKGNAVVIEWLSSPFAYAGDTTFREEARALADRVVRPGAVALHYLHLGERQRRLHFTDERAVELKIIFYALRPAAALRWLRLHPEQALAPMHFPTLVEEGDLPKALSGIVADLLTAKARTRELGSGPMPAPVARFIDEEFALARERWPASARRADPSAVEAADAFFRRWLERAAV